VQRVHQPTLLCTGCALCLQISTDLRAALEKEKVLRPDAAAAAAAAQANGSEAEGAPASAEAAPAAAARGGALVAATDLVPLCGPLAACLKPYQVVGVNFLLLLARERVGGAILADAMGLVGDIGGAGGRRGRGGGVVGCSATAPGDM
jgi:SWI/SNF-related matrix-associated actin-dependent regulator 1 of chromatin subfamily A